MTIEEVWFALLTTAPTFSGYVNGRVYPDVIPQEVTLPACHFSNVTERPFVAHDGDAGLSAATMQTDLWSETRLEAARMRDALRADLHGYKGVVQGVAVSVVVDNVIPDFSVDLRLKRYIVECTVMYGSGE